MSQMCLSTTWLILKELIVGLAGDAFVIFTGFILWFKFEFFDFPTLSLSTPLALASQNLTALSLHLDS